MRKMLNLSLLYFILAMVCGVFYREFTKINGYEGRTALAFAHVHFMVLGMALFLILALSLIHISSALRQIRTTVMKPGRRKGPHGPKTVMHPVR